MTFRPPKSKPTLCNNTLNPEVCRTINDILKRIESNGDLDRYNRRRNIQLAVSPEQSHNFIMQHDISLNSHTDHDLRQNIFSRYHTVYVIFFVIAILFFFLFLVILYFNI